MKATRPGALYEIVLSADTRLRLTCLQQGVVSAIKASPWGCASREDLRAILRHPRTGKPYGSGIDHAIADLQRLGLIRRLPAADERVAHLA